MANFPELRPGERSAEAERVAVLRSASPVRLAALAIFAAAIFMAIVQLGAPGRSEGPPAFLSKALGAADSEAPLVRHPEAGVELAIQDSSFRIRSSSATVTLATQGAGPGDWHRFEHGVSRPIAEGAETILVDGPTLEQFLTIRERQGLRTWRWRIDTAQVPRVGDDGAVAFLDTKLHRLTDVSIAPVGDPRRRGQGRHAQRPPLERRASERRLVADASPRRLEAPPPLRHRPGRRRTGTHRPAPQTGAHLGLGDEADRRADERPPRRARDGDRQRDGEPRTAPDGRAIDAPQQRPTRRRRRASTRSRAAPSRPPTPSPGRATRPPSATVTAYYGVKSTSPFDAVQHHREHEQHDDVTAPPSPRRRTTTSSSPSSASASNSTYTPPGSWNERADVGIDRRSAARRPTRSRRPQARPAT